MTNNISGEKLKKVLKWIADELAAHPEKKRNNVIMEAEVRFDLSPRDCQFVNDKLMDQPEDK